MGVTCFVECCPSLLSPFCLPSCCKIAKLDFHQESVGRTLSTAMSALSNGFLRIRTRPAPSGACVCPLSADTFDMQTVELFSTGRIEVQVSEVPLVNRLSLSVPVSQAVKL